MTNRLNGIFGSDEPQSSTNASGKLSLVGLLKSRGALNGMSEHDKEVLVKDDEKRLIMEALTDGLPVEVRKHMIVETCSLRAEPRMMALISAQDAMGGYLDMVQLCMMATKLFENMCVCGAFLRACYRGGIIESTNDEKKTVRFSREWIQHVRIVDVNVEAEKASLAEVLAPSCSAYQAVVDRIKQADADEPTDAPLLEELYAACQGQTLWNCTGQG